MNRIPRDIAVIDLSFVPGRYFSRPVRVLIKRSSTLNEASESFLRRKDLVRIHVIGQEIKALAYFANISFGVMKLEFKIIHDFVGEFNNFAQRGFALGEDHPVIHKPCIEDIVQFLHGQV